MNANGQTIDVDALPFEQQVALLIEDLPTPLQKFLRGPERDAVSLRLTQKYQLHADQGGAFERAYLYLLLGVNTPDEFVQDMREAGIEEDKIKSLTADINEQVFKKLQQEERKEASPVPVVPVAGIPAEKDSPASALKSTDYPAEQLAAAYQRTPQAVRAYLGNAELTGTVRGIRTGHRLPSAVANELGEKIGFLLLGLMTPNQLRNQLVLAGAAPDAAQNVLDEIQHKILDRFAVTAPQPVAASLPHIPVMPASVSVPHQAPAAIVPHARTMAGDMEAMQHPQQRQASIHPAQATPARSFQTASVPSTVTPAPAPVPTVPTYTPPPAPPAPAPHSEWKPAPAPGPGSAPRAYNADPYRELPE